jgi:magnesium chelatase family protein
LAQRGVLFLDELPKFDQRTLEGLRRSLEDQVVTIARAHGTLTFPANFQLNAATNPCQCGCAQRGDNQHECTCTCATGTRYQKRISGPVLDRIGTLRVSRSRAWRTKSSRMGAWASRPKPCAPGSRPPARNSASVS